MRNKQKIIVISLVGSIIILFFILFFNFSFFQKTTNQIKVEKVEQEQRQK